MGVPSSTVVVLGSLPGCRSAPPIRGHSWSVQAELVALRVAHDIRERPAIAVRLGQLRAKSDEAIDLGRLAIFIDMDVQMHPVLRRLAFGHALEEEPGLDTPPSPDTPPRP